MIKDLLVGIGYLMRKIKLELILMIIWIIQLFVKC